MVSATSLSPSDAAGQEAVVGSAQRVVVTRARAPRDTAVQHCLEYFGFQHSDLELKGGARSVVQFEGILPETAPRVTYAPVIELALRTVTHKPWAPTPTYKAWATAWRKRKEKDI